MLTYAIILLCVLDGHASPHRLRFESSSSALLHQTIKLMAFPLSLSDKALIDDMLYSILPSQLKQNDAAWDDAVGMAANQWGINKRIFLFAPEGTDKRIEIIINPEYIPASNQSEYEWEGCFSLPLAVGYVRRYKKIKVKYQNEQGQRVVNYLSGYPARVWQHETDHLNGFLYDDASQGICLEKKLFPTREQAATFYEAKEREKLS